MTALARLTHRRLQLEDWRDAAACPPYDTAIFFPATADEIDPTAAALCESCPARRECLEYALADPSLDGTWAGTTEPQRRAIRRSQTYRLREIRRQPTSEGTP